MKHVRTWVNSYRGCKRAVKLYQNAAELNKGLNLCFINQIVGQTELLASATEEVSATTRKVSGSLELVAEIGHSSTQSAEGWSTYYRSCNWVVRKVGSILASAAEHIQQLEKHRPKLTLLWTLLTVLPSKLTYLH